MIMTLNTAHDCSLNLNNKVMIDFVKEMMDVLFADNQFLNNVPMLASDTIVVKTTGKDGTEEKKRDDDEEEEKEYVGIFAHESMTRQAIKFEYRVILLNGLMIDVSNAQTKKSKISQVELLLKRLKLIHFFDLFGNDVRKLANELKLSHLEGVLNLIVDEVDFFGLKAIENGSMNNISNKDKNEIVAKIIPILIPLTNEERYMKFGKQIGVIPTFFSQRFQLDADEIAINSRYICAISEQSNKMFCCYFILFFVFFSFWWWLWWFCMLCCCVCFVLLFGCDLLLF